MILHHIAIQTDKYEESLRFYINILGFELVDEWQGFHGREYNSWLKLGDLNIELQTNKFNESLFANHDNSKGLSHFCLYTENIQNEYDRITNIGFNSFIPRNGSDIYKGTRGKVLKMRAPEGTIVELRDTVEI